MAKTWQQKVNKTTKLKNPGPISFKAVIQTELNAKIDSAWVVFPFDLKTTYGKGNLVPVVVVFDNLVQYSGSLAKMGGDFGCILLRKDIRQKLGKQAGDEVLVKVILDETIRTVEIPNDLKNALVAAGLLEKFELLAYTHRKEYANWLTEAKKPETRQRRILKTIDMLLAP
jgi:hypothetical protein